MEVKTQGRGESTLRKGFTVFTNDPSRSEVRLMVVGKVKGFISLSPPYIRFMGKAGQSLSKTITIKPLNNHTFNIKDISAREGIHLKYDLKPIGGDKGEDGYRLMVQNTLYTAGSYHDVITIKTDSEIRPTLSIRVSARIHSSAAQGQPKPQ